MSSVETAATEFNNDSVGLSVALDKTTSYRMVEFLSRGSVPTARRQVTQEKRSSMAGMAGGTSA